MKNIKKSYLVSLIVIFSGDVFGSDEVSEKPWEYTMGEMSLESINTQKSLLEEIIENFRKNTQGIDQKEFDKNKTNAELDNPQKEIGSIFREYGFVRETPDAPKEIPFVRNVFDSDQVLTEEEINKINNALNYIVPTNNQTVQEAYNLLRANYSTHQEYAKKYLSSQDFENETSNINNSFQVLKSYGLEGKKLDEIQGLIKHQKALRVALEAFGFKTIPSKDDLEEARKRLLNTVDHDSFYNLNQIEQHYNTILNYNEMIKNDKILVKKNRELGKNQLKIERFSFYIGDPEKATILNIFKAFGLDYSPNTSWEDIENAYNDLQESFGNKSKIISEKLKKTMTLLEHAKSKNELPFQKTGSLKRTSSYEFEDDAINTPAKVDENAQKNSELEYTANLEKSYRSLGLNFSEDTTWDDILSANKKIISSKDKTPAEKKEIMAAMNRIEEAKNKNQLPYQNKL